MKILTIRFANLNSLAGEWFIDFTSPEYISSGIFAIVGATGSGKSTILDAISLALYGRTPRLRTVSKSSNEIMSRQTGFCFAEVEFISVRGQYRSHWSQHRARKIPSGDLQQPRHEIVDATDDRILASKIKDVAEYISILTGMNFDQFTRSMLLAQGDFSKFLQAGSDDRAPILEQITGTEIYSRISLQVHKQKTVEEGRLKALRQEIEGLNLMTDAEEDECRQTLKRLYQQVSSLQQMITKNSEASSWLKTLQHLKTTIDRQNRAVDDVTKSWKEAKPRRRKVQRAEAAQSFAARFTHLTQLKTSQQEELTAGERAIKQRESVEQTLHTAREREKDYAAKRMIAIDSKEKTEKIISEVIRLDFHCNQQEKSIIELQKAIEEDNRQLGDLNTQIIELTTGENDLSQQLQELTDYLDKHTQEGDLVENFTGIQERFSSFSRLVKKFSCLSAQHQRVAKEEAGIREKENRDNHAVNQARALVAGYKKTIDSLNAELKQLTDLDMATLYRLSQQQADNQAAVLEAIKVTLTIVDCKKAIIQLGREFIEGEKRAKALKLEIAREDDRHRLLRVNVAKQEDIVIFANKIEAYEKERLKLQEGTPCPLCGSTEHPYIQGDTLSPDQARQKLFDDRELLEQCDAKRKVLQTELEILDHKLKLTRRNRQEKEEQQQQLATELSNLSNTTLFTNETPLADLRALAGSLVRDLDKTRETTLKAEKITATRVNLERRLQNAVESLHTVEETWQKSQFGLFKAQENVKQINAELSELEKEQKNTIENLGRHISPYSTEPLTVANITGVLAQLEEKKDKWKTTQQKKKQREALRQSLQAKRATAQLTLAHTTKAKGDKDKKLLPLKEELTSLRTKRFTIFGDKDPEKTARNLQVEVDRADRALKSCVEKITEYDKTVSTLSERAANLKTATDKRNALIVREEDIFRAQLFEAGFKSEAEFKSALLPPEELQKLQSSLDELKREETEALALLASSKKNLKEEQKKQLSTQSLETITAELAEQVEKLSDLQQKLGAEKNRLAVQDQVKSAQGAKKQQLKAQEEEFFYWVRLHDLIGSADGKKFRNFAQGLTFELMVKHANRNLARMSERYLLVRHPDHPLELNVIDNYQAGEIRSTANLSGGESFIISLALALGLASMAGKNIQVNSLFLDEGFGTLDEDSLEVALETLSSLQHEGKIIGIISHVPLLKERISVQLQLTAGFTGRSRISGPGVRAVG